MYYICESLIDMCKYAANFHKFYDNLIFQACASNTYECISKNKQI